MILLIIGALIVLALIVWLVVFVTTDRPNLTDQSAVNAAGADNGDSLPVPNRLVVNDNTTVPETVATAPVLDSAQAESIALEQLARTFAARFGSYSNQSNFENIKDLQQFMTPSMRAWSDQYIADNSAGAASSHWGVITNALAIASSAIGADSATIVVTTRRKEINGQSGEYKTYNQDLKLMFKSSSQMWLVDGAYWQ